MRRFLVSILVLALLALAAAARVSAQNPHTQGGNVKPQRPCSPDCDPVASAWIITNGHTNGIRNPENTYSYTVTVQNTSWGASGTFEIYCTTLVGQMPCVSANPSSFTLSPSQTVDVTVTYQALGLGHYSHRLDLIRNDDVVQEQLVQGPDTVIGIPIQTHVNPLEGQNVTATDSIKVTFSHASGTNVTSYRLFIDGVDSSVTTARTTGLMTRPIGNLAYGTRRITTYGCANNGRCDSLTTTFFVTSQPPSLSLDDSIPPAQNELISGILPGALPLPPDTLRGCPMVAGYPDIILSTPFTYAYQPANTTTPGGDIFMASVHGDTVLTITSTMQDNPAGNGRTCAGLTFLTEFQYDWNYWQHTDPQDSLWLTYPYGDRQGGFPQSIVVGPVEDATLSGASLSQGARASSATATGNRRRSGGGGVVPMVGSYGVRDETYWVKLNGTYIVQGGAPVQGTGVIQQSRTPIGATYTLNIASSLLHKYDPGNPMSDNGGWNEVIAGVKDSSYNQTQIRARFVVIGPGPVADIPIAPLRDFRHLDQGECAAFGAFQCGGVMLIQPIPGLVTRDRDRSLHLVYRSGSQRVPMAIPYQVTVDRRYKAPDSLWVRTLVSGVRQDSLRYLGLRCTGSQPSQCANDFLLNENTTAQRVVAALLPAPSSGDAFGPVVTGVRGFYSTGPRENSFTQDIPRLYWADTVATRFGSGWQLAELGRLIRITPASGADAAIYALGDGSYTVFRKNGGVWVAPPGETAHLLENVGGDPYRIEFANGTGVAFRSDGWQAYSRDLIGNQTQYWYSGTSGGPRLDSIVDPSHFRYGFLYGATPGQIAEIHAYGPSVDQKLATLGYDASRRLRTVSLWSDDTHSETTTFGYLASVSGALVDSVTDPRGSLSTFIYDTWLYTPLYQVRPPRSNGVRDTAFVRDPWRREAPRTTRGRFPIGSYPTPERLLTTDQARGTFIGFDRQPTDFLTDAFGGPTYVRRIAPPPILTMPGFLMVSFGADDVRRITRDSTGRVLKVVVMPDSASVRDSVVYEYDANGNLLRLIRPTAQYPAGTSTLDTASFTYDSLTTGFSFTSQRCTRMLTQRDQAGGVANLYYDLSSAVGRCLPTRIVGLAGETTQFSYGALTVGDHAGVRPTSVTAPTGVAMTATYSDARWNTATTTRTADGAVSYAFYDVLGRPDSMVDPTGIPTVTHRDRLGRVRLARTGTTANAPISATFYAPGGLVDSVRVYGSSAITGSPATPVQTTRYRYNALGWADTVVQDTGGTLNGRRQVFKRDARGQPVIEYPGNGGYIYRAYDWKGRLTGEALSPVGPGFSTDGQMFADAATNAFYLNFGMQFGVTLSLGQVHEYSYDDRDRVLRTDDSLVIHRRVYSPQGALILDSLTFAAGATVVRRFQYNRRGQRTQVRDSVLAGATRLGVGRIDYAWDATTGRLTGQSGVRTGINNSDTTYATVAWQYDRAGRDSVRTVTAFSASASTALTTQWGYDSRGRLTSMSTTSPQGTWYGFSQPTYALNDLLTQFYSMETQGGGGPATTVQYLNQFTYAGDGTGRLVTSGRLQGSTSGPNYTWWYDVFGNRAREYCTNTGCGNDDTLRYGPDNRLLSKIGRMGGGQRRSNVYWTDAMGSRLARSDSVGGVIQAGPQELMSYTARGQLFYSETQTGDPVTYDHNWHWYDGDGLRVLSHVTQAGGWNSSNPPTPATGGTRTYYIYDGSDVAITLVGNSSGPPTSLHQRFLVGGVDQPLAVWTTNSGSGTVGALALIADRQGSIRQAMTPAGLSEGNANYWNRNAFGSLLGASGTGGNVNTQTGFTGASTPNQTGGFTYLRNRWYDPATGRFLTQDPIGLAGGVNLYAYAGNDPVTFTDPFGLCCDASSLILQRVQQRIEGAWNRIFPTGPSRAIRGAGLITPIGSFGVRDRPGQTFLPDNTLGPNIELRSRAGARVGLYGQLGVEVSAPKPGDLTGSVGGSVVVGVEVGVAKNADGLRVTDVSLTCCGVGFSAGVDLPNSAAPRPSDPEHLAAPDATSTRLTPRQ